MFRNDFLIFHTKASASKGVKNKGIFDDQPLYMIKEIIRKGRQGQAFGF